MKDVRHGLIKNSWSIEIAERVRNGGLDPIYLLNVATNKKYKVFNNLNTELYFF
jgi:hypothetical protein